MLYSSFKPQKAFNANIISLPTSLDWVNYEAVLDRTDSNLFGAVLNSVQVTVISLFFIVLFGYILGYILGRIRFRGNRIVYTLFLFGMLIPVHALMVPIYVLFSRSGLTNSLYGLSIPYAAFGLPIVIFLVEGYVKSIPGSIEEAAAIDGSSFTRTTFSIMMPISRPILVTGAIIQTFFCWNEFAFALTLISSAKNRTVPLELSQLRGQYTSNYPRIFATMLITMLPVVVFYFVFSKQIIKGMVTGAVKG